jgi:hypothetical protein
MAYYRKPPVSKAQRRGPVVTLLSAAALCAWFYAVVLGIHAIL